MSINLILNLCMVFNSIIVPWGSFGKQISNWWTFRDSRCLLSQIVLPVFYMPFLLSVMNSPCSSPRSNSFYLPSVKSTILPFLGCFDLPGWLWCFLFCVVANYIFSLFGRLFFRKYSLCPAKFHGRGLLSWPFEVGLGHVICLGQ